MANNLKGIENYFELTEGSSYGGLELSGVDCIYFRICNATFRVSVVFSATKPSLF